MRDINTLYVCMYVWQNHLSSASEYGFIRAVTQLQALFVYFNGNVCNEMSVTSVIYAWKC